MAGVSDEWRWVDPQGVQSTTDKWELVSLLSTAEIPYFTLVWRPGWAEWLPACRVDELTQAVGEAAEPAVEPRRDRTAKLPPPPPLYKYHAYQAREGEPGRSGPKRPKPTTAATKDSREGPRPGEDELGRRPMPTLADEPAPRGGSTLRPPAAVPPPPRAMPQGPQAAQLAAKVNILEELTAEGTAATTDASPPVGNASTSATHTDAAQPNQDLGHPAVRDTRSGPQARTTASRAPLTPLIAAVLIACVAMVLGAAATVVLLTKRVAAPTASVAATPVAHSASASTVDSAPPPAPKPCLLARSARRIYGAAERSVPQFLLTLPDQRVAVGLAASPTTAVGLLIEPESLTIKQELLETDDAQVSGVVPVYDTALSFAVDREGDELRQPHTVTKDLAVGMTDEGFARRRDDRIETIWAGGEDEPTTAPRTVTIGQRGHVVTFRRGGQKGSVLVGWLKPDGSKAGPLERVAGEGLSGTPSVAANPTHILVTFASRPDPDAKWGAALAIAPNGSPPQRSVPFVIPPGGPGVETIAPSSTGLEDGRWVLQWTEGATGNRQVRAQTLASDLTPIGDAITLSAVEDNAGQGVVHAVKGQVLSLFLVIRGGERQLWAAALKCD